MFQDFRHLYYAAWHSPQTTAAKFLTKAVTRWKHHALLMDLRWGLVRGSLPKRSLDSMWALVSLTVAGRSLRLRQEENMHKLLDAFWLPCGFTGPFHLGELAMNSTDLTCCGSAAVPVDSGFVDGVKHSRCWYLQRPAALSSPDALPSDGREMFSRA